LYRFGPFRVDAVRGLLFRDNEPVPLTGKCFETLLILVKNRETTVSKDVLMKAVWPNTFVEESNLTQHISLLRRALGESPQDRLYIVTVPGQGYRFVAKVKEIQEGNSENIAEANASSSLAAGGSGELPALSSSTFTGNKKPWLFIVGTVVVLLAAVAGLWMLHVRAAPVLTEKDSVLLTDFENTTGEVVFDGALKEGMAVELGQSPFLDVVADDRVRETLHFMGRSPDESIRLPLAREVCQRLGSKALISGSLARLGTSYVVAVEAANCSDATALAREQVEAKTKEDVLPVLGNVGARLRRKLGESLSSIQQFDAPIVQATTPSLNALKSYSLGVQVRTRSEREAVPLFEHAIELDSNFAMAYAQLGAVYNNLGETDRASNYIKQAFGLRTNLSEREKLYLTVRYHTVVTGEIGKATETYELWSRIYPRDWTPYNGLAARYQVTGQYEKAKAAAATALKLEPNHYSPYANLAMSELDLNELNEAKRVCEQAAAAGRDSIYTHRVIFQIAFLQHDQVTMQHEVGWARGTEWEHDMLTIEAQALAASGKLRAARQLFQQAWDASQRNALPDHTAYSMAGEALAEADFGNYSQARARADAALRLGRGIDAQATVSEALALSGDVRQARILVQDLRRRFPQHAPLNMASLPSVLASVELQQSNPSKAIQILQEAAPYDWSEFSSLSPVYIRALAYLQAQTGKEAAAEFQKILDHPGIDTLSQRHALAYLGLARSYGLTGDIGKSRKAYQDFFALWSEADSDIPELRKARLEYQKFGSGG
jgi:DNA-binding winged helix-turn-helix (wHTH) protein/tetratricopeptide (TPR) repeat protein